MSRRRGDGRGDYEVGYGKPPKRTRFQKGRSGNPAGRRKGAGGKHKLLENAIHRLAREIILTEAHRPMQVRDGETMTTIPALQAVCRSAMLSGAKGSALAQKTVLALALKAEEELASTVRENFNGAVLYKEECEAKRRQCRRDGLPDPNFFPHPDDIFVDWETFRVEFRGPVTSEQQAALQRIIDARDEHERGFANMRAESKANPRDVIPQGLAIICQQRFDWVNDLLPDRYRKKLDGRIREEEIASVRKKVKRWKRKP